MDVKTFLTFFFYFGHVFLRYFNDFLFSKRLFLFKKTLAKFRAATRLTKKHFQNNSNEIDL